MHGHTHAVSLIAGAVGLIAIMTAHPAAAQTAQAEAVTATGIPGRIAKFYSATGLSSSVMRESAGKIAIGANPPQALLQITNNSAYPRRGSALAIVSSHVNADLGNTFTGFGLIDQGGTTNGYSGIWQLGGKLQFQSAEGTLSPVQDVFKNGAIGPSIAHMTINRSGKVGIGTINPTEGYLHVIGPQGIYGHGTQDSSAGVFGYSSHQYGAGIIGQNQIYGGLAGWFQGPVKVEGTLTKPAGSFLIDHPLDPANKKLSHSFVESPDMMNIYNGVAVLDADGRATVMLPGYFGALNKDFRYQLTAIGAPGPNLHISEEIADNRFAIAGGRAGQKVSWQVTGVRQDAYAVAHRIPVEEEKPAGEKGLYLYPIVIGQPESKGITFALKQRMRAGNEVAQKPTSGNTLQQAALPR